MMAGRSVSHELNSEQRDEFSCHFCGEVDCLPTCEFFVALSQEVDVLEQVGRAPFVSSESTASGLLRSVESGGRSPLAGAEPVVTRASRPPQVVGGVGRVRCIVLRGCSRAQSGQYPCVMHFMVVGSGSSVSLVLRVSTDLDISYFLRSNGVLLWRWDRFRDESRLHFMVIRAGFTEGFSVVSSANTLGILVPFHMDN